MALPPEALDEARDLDNLKLLLAAIDAVLALRKDVKRLLAGGEQHRSLELLARQEQTTRHQIAELLEVRPRIVPPRDRN